MENTELECSVEDYLDGCVISRGGVTRKLQYIGARGCPDRLIVLPFFLGLAELKRPKGGRYSVLQDKELKLLGSIHAAAALKFHTKAQIWEWFRDYDREWGRL